MTASTLTSNDYCARVRATWTNQLPLNLIPRADHNIALCLQGACDRLGRSVKNTTDQALLMVEITNKTPVSGVIDLTNSAYLGILTDSFKWPGAIKTNTYSAVTFHHALSLNDLLARTPTDTSVVWYLLQGSKLIFKNPADGALNTYATALALTGAYIPIFGDATRPIPFELEDQLISRISEMVKELGGLEFLKMDPDQAMQAVGK